MSSNSDKTVVVILGPTAVGKTKLCFELAKHFSAEIISADSRQFFRELKIGTATPSQTELDEVKHHFIGNISIHDYYNVSMFEEQALACTYELFKHNNYVFLTGGSGLYISSFCDGIDDLPDPTPEIRQQLKDTFTHEGLEPLRMQLKIVDPDYYNIADLANPKRIMRALEVFLTTGLKYSQLRKQTPKSRDFSIIKIGLNRKREELFEIINQRVDQMIEQGLVDEALQFYPLKQLNALNTVGYKELFEYFAHKITREKAIENIKTNTRRYAKRQLTWFRKDTSINWFQPEQKEEIIAFIKNNKTVNAIQA